MLLSNQGKAGSFNICVWNSSLHGIKWYVMICGRSVSDLLVNGVTDHQSTRVFWARNWIETHFAALQCYAKENKE